MGLKSGYKQTEVGVIPEDWTIKSLSEVSDIRSGGTPSTSESRFWDGSIPWCTPTDITALKGTKSLKDTDRKISRLGLNSSSAELLPVKSIVMTSRATIGECAINEVPISTNQGFKNFIPNSGINVDFLYYLLTTQRDGFIKLCGGSTFLEIGKSQLATYHIPLPPTKAEQEAIAEALSDADALIASLEQLIAKKRLIKQGAMQELLTGKRRLPGFSGDLKCGTLCELIEAKAPKPTPRGFCTFTFLGMEDISEEGRIIRQSLRVSSELKSGFTYFGRNDIIVAKITPCFENGKGTFLGSLQTVIGYGSTEFHVLRVKAGVDPRYVYFQTRDTEFRRKLEGEMIGTAGQKRVPRSAILDYQMPVVHTSKEQTAIATVLSEMDEEIDVLETKLAKARLIKQGMMQELLTGRIRLV